MQTVRWGIIGCGDVTEVKSGPALQRAERSQLTAVMRRDGAKAQDYAQRHGVPRWYDDADALINDPEVDAVYIATPPGSHMDYALRVAAAGKPVYVEKPMARTYEECMQMVDGCAAVGVPLFVAYYRRMLPRFLRVRDLLAEGAIGEVRTVSLRLYSGNNSTDFTPGNIPWRVQPELAGAGLVLDLGSHMLDLLDYLVGPIDAVQGMATNQAGLYAAEDTVVSSFSLESGALGTAFWCFSAYNSGTWERTEIIGSKGRIIYSNFADEPIELHGPSGVMSFEIANPPHIQQPLIQTIVDELCGIGTCPSTGITAARTSRVLDEMLSGWRAEHGVFPK
ncbi:MAG: Gfo/Idh/MocA family oxidoreductase [bacterium]